MAAGVLLITKVVVAYITRGESLLIATLYITGMVLPLFAAAGVAGYFGGTRTPLVRVGIYMLVVLAFVSSSRRSRRPSRLRSPP